jgi:two-component system response regulator
MYEDTRRVVATDHEELEARYTARELPVAHSVVHSGTNNRTVLLVQSDPEEEFLTLLAFQKVKLKNRVLVVRDGIDALNYLFSPGDYQGRNTEFMPELILLDLTMPHSNGADLLRRMRLSERTKSLPVLGLISSTEEQDVLEGQDLEADGYIQKPIEPVRLLEALERLERLHWVISD